MKTTEINNIFGAILKEGFIGPVASNPSFGMNTTKILGPVLGDGAIYTWYILSCNIMASQGQV